LASADEDSIVAWAHQRVDAGLLKPLAAVESHRSRFSRERSAPHARRIRIEETTTTNDASGHPFIHFAVDGRWGEEWEKDDILGCVYGGTGKIFVKVGDQYWPAGFYLGKNVEAVTGVCEAAPGASGS
jgi:hypothetical protein